MRRSERKGDTTFPTLDDELALAREREALLVAANDAFATLDDPDALIDALLAIIVPQSADYAVIDLFDDDGRFERYAFSGPEHVRVEIERSRAEYPLRGAPVGSSWYVAETGNAVFVNEKQIPDNWPEATRAYRERLGVFSAIVVPLLEGGRRLGALAVARIDRSRGDFRRESLDFYADIAARAATALRRTRATSALMRSEQLYRTLADRMPQIVGITDPDGRVFYLNGRSAEYTGAPVELNDDERWRPFIHPEDVERLGREWEKAIASGMPHETRYRMRRKDGVYRWFLNQAVPIRDESGKIVSWIGTATDIDEHHRRENSLRVAVDAGDLFARTLDTETALQQLADLAVRHLADWCGVYVYDAGGQLQPVAIAHVDPSKVRLVREFHRRYPIVPDDAIARVAQTEVPSRIGPITQEMYDVVEDIERREMARSLGLHAVMNVPLAVGGQRFGAFSLALSETKRLFDDDDERVATMLAQRAAIALGNARLFERQREVARTLQSGFLPASLPAVDGAAFDAVYVSGTRDVLVGGDWYDAEVRDDGGIMLTIGDVAGHGLDAAVTMGKMRQTFRALGSVDDDPAHAMLVADRILRREHPDVFVTAFLAIYDPLSNELRSVNAGHPAPFVRESDGTIRRIATTGVPLGLTSFDPPTVQIDRLTAQTLFVAVTDGLIEQNRDITEGEARVSNALAHPAFALCSTPAALLRALLVDEDPRDDVAILTLRIGGGPDWSFATSDADAAHAARQAFVARIRAAGLAEDLVASAELVLGEVVGNAVRYARGTLDLALACRPGALVLHALDRGPGLRWRPGRPADDSETGRGLFLIEALSQHVRCEHLQHFGTYLAITLQGSPPEAAR